MKKLARPTAIDCFAGAGGLSLGLMQAGFDVRAAFDSSPQAVATYRRNAGNHIIEARAEDIGPEDLLTLAGLNRGECSLVAGGPPCQGFSVQRRGQDEDARNDLVLLFLEFIVKIRPMTFLMENVSGLAGPRGREHWAEFLRRAERAGYRVHARVLNAADYGVPQHRRRMFVVGETDAGMDYFAFPEPTHGLGTYRTVRDGIGDLPSPEGAPELARLIPNHERDNMSELNKLRISHVPQGGGREHIPADLRLPCHRVSVEKAGHRNVYGRLAWDQPAGTITTKCNSFTRGKFAHPGEDRNISMREAARLQSFPDSFIFEGDKVAIAHQIGNAVPPLVGTQIGAALISALEARELGIPRPSGGLQLSLMGSVGGAHGADTAGVENES